MNYFYFLLFTILFAFPKETLAQIDADTCDDAETLFCGTIVNGTTADNTDTTGNPAPDEFYSYTGNGEVEEITISLCEGTTYDSLLRLYDSCDLTNPLQVNDDACNFQSEIEFVSDGTTTYIIMVEGFGANSGVFELAITCESGVTNDNCLFATPITCGDVVAGETTMDTDSGFNSSPDEFFIFTGEGFEQQVTVSMCDDGTNYDSFLRVFNSCDLNNQIVNNDDSCGFQSEVEFVSDGTSSYIIMVEGFDSNSGDFSLSISCSGSPMPPPNDLIENSIDISDFAQGGSGTYTDPAVASQDATPEIGTPNDCDLAGIEGVWYHFTPQSNIGVFGSIASPSGVSSVIFFTAPNDNATVDDLTRVDQDSNPCFTGTNTEIIAEGGQTYYAFAANKGGSTDFTFDFAFLGVEANVFKDFTFYPNPAKSILSLSATSPIENMRITNILGQTMLTQDIGTLNKTLDVSALQTGNYFMEITIDKLTNIFQFIKE